MQLGVVLRCQGCRTVETSFHFRYHRYHIYHIYHLTLLTRSLYPVRYTSHQQCYGISCGVRVATTLVPLLVIIFLSCCLPRRYKVSVTSPVRASPAALQSVQLFGKPSMTCSTCGRRDAVRCGFVRGHAATQIRNEGQRVVSTEPAAPGAAPEGTK